VRFSLVVTGSDIAQAISRRLPTSVSRVRSQVRSYGISGAQIGTRSGFLPVHRLPLPILIALNAPYSSSGAGTIGQLVVDVQSVLRFTPPYEIKEKSLVMTHVFEFRMYQAIISQFLYVFKQIQITKLAK
jgi:hypothetical protein